MFFIIWGTKTKDEPYGVVADVCPECDRPRAFNVKDVFTAPHIYYVSVGRWNFQCCVKRCWDCGTEFYARPEDYDRFVDLDEAEELSLRALARRTNEPLAEWMDNRSAADGPMPVARRTVKESPEEADARRAREARRQASVRIDTWRVPAIVVAIMGLLGAFTFGAIAFKNHRDLETARDGPVAVDAADLVERGPQGARFVRVTGLQVSSEFWQDGGRKNDSRPCWLAAAPAEDQSLDRPKNVPPTRLVLLRVPERKNDQRLAEITTAG